MQERARVAEQIERDVAERHVLLELGCPRDPPSQLLRQNQRVVAQPQRILGDVRRGYRVRGAGELGGQVELVDGDRAVDVECFVGIHRWGTPSEAL
jgi:hypothetical protein